MLDQTTTMMLECSACGAKANAECACGVEYVPAGTRAAAAIAKNPEKSDRAIAAEIGANQSTVSRRRNNTTDARASVEGNQSAGTQPVGTKRIGKDGRTRRVPQVAHKKPTGVIQRQASIDVKPKVWDAFKEQAEAEGISAAAKLGKMITHTVSKSQPKESAEIMVSLSVLTEKLVPLAHEIAEQSKRHIGKISTGRLTIIASEILRFLEIWASSGKSVRRVHGHVTPSNHPATGKEG